MNLTTALPSAELGRSVDSLIHYTGYNPEHRIERVIPDGSLYLVFELDGRPRRIFDNETLEPIDAFEHAWLSGMHRHFISIEACPDSSMFVVKFKPGGAASVLPEPVDRYSNRVTAAERIFGPGIAELRDRLAAAPEPRSAFAEAEAWLRSGRSLRGPELSAAAGHSPVSEAIFEAVEGITRDPSFARTTLAELVRRSGYSRKHFIAQFKRQVGLTPKLFQRIMRFREIMPRIVEQRRVSWTEISLECGYFDQSHFIREFKAFSGYNPRRLLTGPASDRVNFFPVA